jgi:hypothetical protein
MAALELTQFVVMLVFNPKSIRVGNSHSNTSKLV